MGASNSLSSRFPKFNYDSESGRTFDVWYIRCEDNKKDGSTLDEPAKARLVVSKLDASAHAQFTIHVFPKKTSEVIRENSKNAERTFRSQNFRFRRRYVYRRTQRHGESLTDYTGNSNQRHDFTKFNTITLEQMKCLVWICGLNTSSDADIRTRALQKLKENPQTTLKEPNAEI